MGNILITGTNKGIGKSLAEKFLKEGHFVIGTYHAGKSGIKNGRFLEFKLDLASEKITDACVRKISATGRKIDILINNAGIMPDENETAVKTDKLRATLEVNLIGTINFTEKIIPLIRKGGHIVNISSTAGSLEFAADARSHYPYHYPAYKISKTALNMYTRTLANRLKKKGITVSSVHPGWVRTDMGGKKAPMSTKEAAEGIYKTAVSNPETGQFWFKSRKLPW